MTVEAKASGDAAQVDDATTAPVDGQGSGEPSKDAAPAGDANPASESILGGEGDVEAGSKDERSQDGGEPGGPTDDGELELTLPEGFNADESMVGWFKSAAKDVGLDSENASKLVAGYAVAAQEALKSQAATYEKQVADWVVECKQDKEVGGQNFAASVKDARLAIKEFGGDGFAQELDRLGISNHPGLFRAFARAGKLLAEDSAYNKRGGGKVEPSMEDKLNKLFPATAPK